MSKTVILEVQIPEEMSGTMAAIRIHSLEFVKDVRVIKVERVRNRSDVSANAKPSRELAPQPTPNKDTKEGE